MLVSGVPITFVGETLLIMLGVGLGSAAAIDAVIGVWTVDCCA